VRIYEQPHLLKGLGSAPFDNDGIATHAKDWVNAGELLGYAFSSYSGRKMGAKSTGNAGGLRNLTLETQKLYLI
jgi:PmbA protein